MPISNSNIFIPATSPDDFKMFLAEPEKQWKTGYSAKSMAYSWCEAQGFPSEISEIFCESDATILHSAIPVQVIPEFKVDLPGGSRASQNDLFVLAKSNEDLISIMVEGKVSEPFGDTVSVWLGDNPSKGKIERLNFLCNVLELESSSIGDIRYQLLHRTVSPLLAAETYNAPYAMMLVHSFSQEDEHFGDYERFLNLFGLKASVNSISEPVQRYGKNLYFGWSRGAAEYLSR